MTEVFTMRITDALTEDVFERLIPSVSQERKRKIQKLRKLEDKKCSLLAEILLRYILIKNYGLRDEDIIFEYNYFGKPKLANDYNIKFNISHSGEFVMCGISNFEIGVDIEKISKARIEIARRCFTKEEYLYILNQPIVEQASCFYSIWTLKESYIKAEGKGLSIPLDTFQFLIGHQTIQMMLLNGEKIDYCFWQSYIHDQYIGAVCSKEAIQQFREVYIDDLLELL